MNKNVTINIDLTINTLCTWIQSQLVQSEFYPAEAIKALAELICARALLEEPYHSFLIHSMSELHYTLI